METPQKRGNFGESEMRGFLLVANFVALVGYAVLMWDEFDRTSSPDFILTLIAILFGVLMALNIGYIQNTPTDPASKASKFSKAFKTAWKENAN